MKSSLWSMVLAAGSGRRLSSLTGGTPKQFWRPVGSTSLVEETLARLAPICPAERTVIVVAEAQRKYVSQWSKAQRGNRVAFQPEDRGTAAGVLFGLVPVLSHEPNAVVLVTPSDHGVGNPDAFRRGILDALAYVQLHDGIVLFGVEPSAAQTDYGWITFEASNLSVGVQPVSSFVEKPSAETARQLFSAGAVWNTMVTVARAQTLLDLCREHLPDLTDVFVDALTLPSHTREAFLAARYPSLSAADFSRDVLTPAAKLVAYTWPASIGWSDLGTPERLRNWLKTAPEERPRVTTALAEARALDATTAAAT
jgi:mannose-1-phosphate guanylyltransferase